MFSLLSHQPNVDLGKRICQVFVLDPWRTSIDTEGGEKPRCDLLHASNCLYPLQKDPNHRDPTSGLEITSSCHQLESSEGHSSDTNTYRSLA